MKGTLVKFLILNKKNTIASFILSIIFIFTVFPSSIFVIVKLLLILGYLVLLSLYVYYEKARFSEFSVLYALFSIGIVYFFFFYSFILGNYDGNDVTHQPKNILIILVLVISIGLSIKLEIISYELFCKFVIISCGIYALVKFFIFLIITSGAMEADEVLGPIKESMPGVVYSKFFFSSWMYRLATSSDILVAIILSIALSSRDFFSRIITSRIVRFSCLFLFFFVILQSYTRYLWLMVFISLILNIRFKSLLIASIFLFLSTILLLVSENEVVLGIVDVINARFLDTGSLETKYLQSTMLLSEFSNYPILGKGAGSFVEGYVRSLEQKYQYENQWLAMGMQFGIVGLFFLLMNFFLIFFKLVINKEKSTVYIVFSLFIASGLTNPNLTTVSTFIIYSIFIYSKKAKIQ